MSMYAVGTLDSDTTTDGENELADYAYHLNVNGAHYEESYDAGADEVPEGGWNRWHVQSYFEHFDRIENPSSSDVAYYLEPRPDGLSGGIYLDGHYPTEFDGDRIIDPTLSTTMTY